jgi:tetratricopeptide (TPR) repeat protein
MKHIFLLLSITWHIHCQAQISQQPNVDIDSLYNIGLNAYMAGEYEKAEVAFTNVVQLAPDDYQACAKLIQVYYARKTYDKAKPYRTKLYEAKKKGLLNAPMKNMFCFDQFKWKDKTIQAYESFQEGEGDEIYNKHLFYLVNTAGKIEYRIQTEYSPTSMAISGTKYLLCTTKGDLHSTYNIGFNDNFNYNDMKKAVIAIIEDKVQPVASSRY